VLKDGRTLPIHFRIEGGIVGSVSVSAATPTVATGGTDQITATVRDLHGVPLAGASVAWSVAAAAGVVASLEPASGRRRCSLRVRRRVGGGDGDERRRLGDGDHHGHGGVAGKSLYVGANGSASIVSTRQGQAGTRRRSPRSLAATPDCSARMGSRWMARATSTSPPEHRQHPGLRGGGERERDADGDDRGREYRTKLPSGIALDGAGNIYVVNTNYNFSGGSITVFAAGASGNATPTATITGGNTGLGAPIGIAGWRGQHLRHQPEPRSITVYAAGRAGTRRPWPRSRAATPD